MKITKEVAKADLEKMLSQFGTIGAGNALDRAAYGVMQTIHVLGNRLSRPETIKLLYFDMNKNAKDILPETVYTTAKEYAVDKAIDLQEAQKRLDAAAEQYLSVFIDMGVKPKEIHGLYQRSN